MIRVIKNYKYILQIKDKKFDLEKYIEYLVAIEEAENSKEVVKAYEYCIERSKFLLIFNFMILFSTMLRSLIRIHTLINILISQI